MLICESNFGGCDTLIKVSQKNKALRLLYELYKAYSEMKTGTLNEVLVVVLFFAGYKDPQRFCVMHL